MSHRYKEPCVHGGSTGDPIPSYSNIGMLDCKVWHEITIWTLHATQITNESCHIRTIIRNMRSLPSVGNRYNAFIITVKRKLLKIIYLFTDPCGIPYYTASNEWYSMFSESSHGLFWCTILVPTWRHCQ